MGNGKAWLLVVAGTLAGLVVGAGISRQVWNAPAAPATPEQTMNQGGCVDISGHKASLITVEPNVQLEVLDWGGTGEPLVLLTGMGDNAHVFDEFAHQFTDRFHVIGITRRGFGRSSQPAEGYDLDTRARDDIAVLDQLNIRQAIFAGHSVAGTELSKLGAAYPERVQKLVYLDAVDIGGGGWNKLPQPPGAPEMTDADLASVQRLAAASAREDGYRKPLAAYCNMVRMDASGKITGPVTPPEIYTKIQAGLKPAELERIQAPVLAILNRVSPQFRMPYYQDLMPAQQAEFDRSVQALSKWIDGAIERYRKEIKNARIIEIPDGNHYVFIVYEGMVVREMRKFLLEK